MPERHEGARTALWSVCVRVRSVYVYMLYTHYTLLTVYCCTFYTLHTTLQYILHYNTY
jgi:hypothetical protein